MSSDRLWGLRNLSPQPLYSIRPAHHTVQSQAPARPVWATSRVAIVSPLVLKPRRVPLRLGSGRRGIEVKWTEEQNFEARFDYMQLDEGDNAADLARTYLALMQSNIRTLKVFGDVFPEAVRDSGGRWALRINALDTGFAIHAERWRPLMVPVPVGRRPCERNLLDRYRGLAKGPPRGLDLNRDERGGLDRRLFHCHDPFLQCGRRNSLATTGQRPPREEEQQLQRCLHCRISAQTGRTPYPKTTSCYHRVRKSGIYVRNL